MLYHKEHILLVFLVSIGLSFHIKAQQKEIKSALYINSYGVTYSWGDSVAKGVIETFKNRPDVILYVEYLDTKRFGTVNYKEYYSLFKKKYRNKKFDVAIVSDNPALNFMIQYGDSLVPGTPVAFCGINDPENYKLDNSNFYGIKEGVDLDSVIHLILRVMPRIENMYFIADSTQTSLTNLANAHKLEPKYANRVKFKYLTNISVDSLYKISGKFEKQSAIALLDIFQDIDKTPINSDVVMQEVATLSNIPIFMDSETSFGKGIVGGIINSGDFHGQTVAKLALKFIDISGFVPDQRVAIPKDNYYFDYKILVKYGIKPDLIPKDSYVINQPESLVKRYFEYVVVFLGVITFLLITNFLSIINIKKRKKTEKLLKESEFKLKEAQQIAKVGHWHFHLKSNIFHWSDEVYRIFGKDTKNFVPIIDNFLDCIHPSDRLRVLDTINDAWVTDEHLEAIYRITSDNGDLKYVLHKFISNPVNMKEAGLYGTIQDITQKRLIEIELEKYQNHLETLVKERTEELEEATYKLQSSLDILSKQKEELNQTIEELNATREHLLNAEKLASLGIFTAGIAHELNNPINFISSGIYAMLNSIDTIKDELGEVSPKVMDNLHDIETLRVVINKGIERAISIVSSLRNYTRSDSDIFEKYDITICLKDALLLLSCSYKNHIEVIKDFNEPIVIDCIPGKINQAFVNIINNAIQSISNNGKIWIKASLSKDSHVMIEVKDNGCGIKEQDIKRIFDPFFTTKEAGKGTGLGLYIVHGIINQHNGNIAVESAVNKGTIFTITLPLSQSN